MRIIALAAVLVFMLMGGCDAHDTPVAPSRAQCDPTEGTLANDFRGEPYDPNAPVIVATPEPPPEPGQPAGFCDD